MERKTMFDKLLARLENNPVVASILVVGTIIIAVSTFTDAARKIPALVINETEKPVLRLGPPLQATIFPTRSVAGVSTSGGNY